METYLGCLLLVALAAAVVPFILCLLQAGRIRALEATLQKLSARLAALEKTGTLAVSALPEERTLPAVAPAPPPPREPRVRVPAIDWEAFMGVKLFAWIGGFALFLGVVFLVKYSFENNLISPALRIVLGAAIGLALLAAGWFTAQRNFRVPGQSLCATGMLVLYADVFGAHAFYGLISLGTAFALMSLITVGAFLLAVRMNAAVVVVLGLVGGFATPLLLTTAEHSLPIFSYLALLNCGIAAIALRQRWDYLFLLAALGTGWIETLWASFHGAAQATAGFAIYLGFEAQFLVFAYLRQRLQPNEKWSTSAAVLPGLTALGYAFFLPGLTGFASSIGFFFGFTLAASVGLLALNILTRRNWIAAVALACTWAVEREWHALPFTNENAFFALGWYLLFALVFIAFPFFTAGEETLPWAVGAFSGLLHFTLIYEAISTAYSSLRNGLLPAVFILPFIVGVAYLIRQRRIAPASGDARLAWQGGAALLFLSLIFPIQFEREWITLGWAVEGLALLLLFRIVPNRGLRRVGGGLLTTAFVRLAFNPAVLEYHRRSVRPIWNWYLYAYGLTSLCLFAGARAARAQFDPLVPRLLYSLGAVLVFLLLNIEIADYFSIGPTLTFSFSGNFARDMTYSIAWSLFALALLLIGMKRQLRSVRYAGLALLVITLLKLFLHDLGNLSQLYRIGAFLGVAVILIVASFVYQRFLRPEPNE